MKTKTHKVVKRLFDDDFGSWRRSVRNRLTDYHDDDDEEEEKEKTQTLVVVVLPNVVNEINCRSPCCRCWLVGGI